MDTTVGQIAAISSVKPVSQLLNEVPSSDDDFNTASTLSAIEARPRSSPLVSALQAVGQADYERWKKEGRCVKCGSDEHLTRKCPHHNLGHGLSGICK